MAKWRVSLNRVDTITIQVEAGSADAALEEVYQGFRLMSALSAQVGEKSGASTVANGPMRSSTFRNAILPIR
jgi:hypothetical protein